MKLNSQIILILLIVGAFTACVVAPVFAESRSVTVRVSCTILPMLEISTPKTPNQVLAPWNSITKSPNKAEFELKTNDLSIVVGTNLGKNYCVSKILLKKDEGRLKLYSVTAL